MRFSPGERTVPQPVSPGTILPSPRSRKRATRVADGYLPLSPIAGTDWDGTMEKVARWLEEAGRTRDSFGIEDRLNAGQGTPEDWRTTIHLWRRFNASHLSVGTGGAGGPDAHIARLKEALTVVRS